MSKSLLEKFILPYYPIPKGETADDELKKLTFKRMKKDFPGLLKKLRKG